MIAEIVKQQQPAEWRVIQDVWGVTMLDADDHEFELTPFQEFLDKLMRQVPRKGRG